MELVKIVKFNEVARSMRIPTFIDSCAWNYFYDRGECLVDLFPHAQFELLETNEVRIERSAIPIDHKLSLRNYIDQSIAANNLKTTYIFGFASTESDGSLSPVQVYGGFDHGAFQSEEHARIYASSDFDRMLGSKPKRGSGLAHNQTDASLAVRAFDSLIVTAEARAKSGPLKWAGEKGGSILHLPEVATSGLSLRDYVQQEAAIWMARRRAS